MHILIINGPNLNLLGQRDPDIYGSHTYAELSQAIKDQAKKRAVDVDIRQSNHEGDLIDWLHDAHAHKFAGVIINPGALTHYSYAIRDAIEAIHPPVVEVHLSDITTRKETFRHTSVIEDVVSHRFYGDGFRSYLNAFDFLTGHLHE